MLHRDDLKLARAVAARDRGAAERFFEEYFPRLYRFVARRVDEAACEDVVQETMIKAMKNLASYRGEAALFTWLCQIGRNEISNYFQRNGRRLQSQHSLDDDPQIRAALESLDSGQLDVNDRLAIEQIVQLTLDYLPEKYSRLLEWKYLEGLSVQEIAARMNTGMVTVQSLLARARSAFRQSYRDLASEVEIQA
jgi:RNA polymerase sigma-70 factor, ECF subfamily